jgi:hemerythrin
MKHRTYRPSDMGVIAPQISPSLSWGCDSRYRSIVNKLDTMIELVREQPDCNLSSDMNQLLDSMKEHFCSENDVLKLVDFPQSITHRFDHYSIFTDAAEVRHLFSKGEETVSNRLSRVRRIFLEHIHVHDRPFEEFLVS